MKVFLTCLLVFAILGIYTCDWNFGFIQEEPKTSDLVGLWEAEAFTEYMQNKYNVSGEMHLRLNEDGTIGDVNFYYQPFGRRDLIHVNSAGNWKLHDANPGGENRDMIKKWDIAISFDDKGVSIYIPLKRISGKMSLYYGIIFDDVDIPFFRKDE